jgi:(p)ppGpp synthase/HD superfamily hydrolase
MLGERFRDALVYAAEAHEGQRRKDGEVPYAAHLLGVTASVLEEGGGEDEAVAALLHDVVEDQGGRPRLDDVRNRFGERVARLVEECSDWVDEPKPPWKQRKERYIERLRTEHDDAAVLVSLADKLYNSRAIVRDLKFADDQRTVWDRFSRDRDCQLWYYRSLVEAFRTRLPARHRLFVKLEAAVDELERLAGGPSSGCPDRQGSDG